MMRGVAAAIAILCLPALAQEPADCTIGGAVTDGDTNKPVQRARVILEAGSYTFLKLTNEQGNFCFENLTSGDYHVTVQKTGYLESGHPVTLAVEENSPVKPLAIRITRYGGLSGAVLDAEGELLPGAVVMVWERARGTNAGGPNNVDSTAADSRGTFHFSQLAPGTYYLSASNLGHNEGRYIFPFADSHGQMPREKEVETFYSASLTFAGATPVELKAGQQVDKLVLTLRRAAFRRVTGRIANPPRKGFLTYSGETETSSDSSGAIPIASDGTFAKADLTPAKYTFNLSDGQKWIARKDVDLTLGDALGVTLEPIETIDVPVTFRTEGKGPAFRPGSQFRNLGANILVRDGSDEAVGLQEVGGTYRFSGVECGIYRLHLSLSGQKLFLKGVTYGGETQTGDKIDLRSAREGGLEITLSSNVAEVQGRATVSEDEAGDLTVILVDGAQVIHETGTDQKGRFRMPAVAPGKYRLYAIEGFDDDDWGSPELAKALEAKSVELELKESDKKQVSVTVISADEWAAAVKKTGG
jgi:hypothetical protein